MQTEQEPTPEEQYENWKANSGYLYDRLIVNTLTWPALSFQWLPESEKTEAGTKYQYLYSTNTSGEQQEYVYVAEMTVPDLKDFEVQAPIIKPTEKILQSIEHPGEVNRLRYNRSNPKQIATKTVTGVINIYQIGLEYPVQLLSGHTEEGYAIDWGKWGLASGGYDGKILVWRHIDQEAAFQLANQNKVEDLKWLDENTVLGVFDGGDLSVWDLRKNAPQETIKAHKGDAYTLDINPINSQLVISGGEDHNIRIWDRRMLSKRLYTFEGHKDTIMRVEWSPHDFNIFCSGALDHKVMVWDILRVGCEVPKDDTNSGPTELLFTHSGHRGPISDLGWNPKQRLVGSVEEEFNSMQFYQMADNVISIQYVEDIQYQQGALLS